MLCEKVFDNYAYLVIPLATGETLLEFVNFAIKNPGKVPKGIELYFFKQVLLALLELYEKSGLSHLDLKLENIVILPDWTLALIDFGHAEFAELPTNRSTGTL
jgi:serine/threonine protein kinase